MDEVEARISVMEVVVALVVAVVGEEVIKSIPILVVWG